MCKDCGCSETAGVHEHRHEDGTVHSHPHAGDHGHGAHAEHGHAHGATPESRRVVELRQNVLAKNDEAARRTRKLLQNLKVLALNIISSPGAGKTTLLERTLDALSGEIKCAVVNGDQSTDNDAKRLSGRGAPVAQIETGNSCHLDAVRVAESLSEVLQKDTRLLLIENVGNLICPAAFDLGEDHKVALLSVTEGEDKPVKYPAIFSQCGLVLITKIDLMPHLDWNRDKCLNHLKEVAPACRVIEVSARTGAGMQEWLEFLRSGLK